MSNINITSYDINLLNQDIQRRYIMLKVVNREMQNVATIQGQFISGSATIDDSSDIRRTANLSFYVDKILLSEIIKPYYDDYSDRHSNFNFTDLFLDKYIRLYLGIEDNNTLSTSWYLQGTYIIGQNSLSFNDKTRELSLTLSDRMID